MHSQILRSLINLARIPDTGKMDWLENAVHGVQFLVQNHEENEKIVLYASGPHLYMHSVLVPCAAINPPDHDDLSQAHIAISDTWYIHGAYIGGEGYRIYLESPLSNPGCKTLVGGEYLIFLRCFEGVESYDSTLEINQKLVHALGLYYMDERQAYCRLNKYGDIEDVITVLDDEHPDSWQRVRAITILGHDLAKYMALSNLALLVKFDFTRFVPGDFAVWDEPDEQTYRAGDLYYGFRVFPNRASYANGHIIFQTNLTENDLIDEWQAEEDASAKQYASFKIFDRKITILWKLPAGRTTSQIILRSRIYLGRYPRLSFGQRFCTSTS